ncbi:MAG: hypothetical protein V3S14_06435, partial [Anaerolineae bacterium]
MLSNKRSKVLAGASILGVLLVVFLAGCSQAEASRSFSVTALPVTAPTPVLHNLAPRSSALRRQPKTTTF